MPKAPIDASTPLPPNLDPRGRHRNRHQDRRPDSGHRGWRTGAARGLLGVASLLSVTLLVAAGYYYYTFRSIDSNRTTVSVPALGVQPSAQPSGVTYSGKDVNILLVGQDDRSVLTATELKELHVNADTGTSNTDTMMVLHLPADGKKATLISLPRDSYVHIAGFGMDRLNSVYAYGYNNAGGSKDHRRKVGVNLLVSTVSNLTGLRINHYIQVNLLGFYEISNAIGGIPVNLCHSVNDTYTYNREHGVTGGSGFHMSKGHHVLRGRTAVEFVRQRHNLPGFDLGRERRQQYFLTAAFRKVASVGILTKLHALGSAIDRNLVTDSGLKLLDIAQQMENLSANNITTATIPTTAATINGADVLQVDIPRIRTFIHDKLNPSATAAKSTASKSASKSTSKKAKPIDSKCIN